MIIDVPHIQQLGRDDCHVACMMMMLGWLKNTYEDSPDLSYDEVKKTMRWTRAGVRFCNAKLINNHKSIQNSRIRPIFYCGPATTIEFLW